jgi:hypothetical protein
MEGYDELMSPTVPLSVAISLSVAMVDAIFFRRWSYSKLILGMRGDLLPDFMHQLIVLLCSSISCSDSILNFGGINLTISLVCSWMSLLTPTYVIYLFLLCTSRDSPTVLFVLGCLPYSSIVHTLRERRIQCFSSLAK